MIFDIIALASVFLVLYLTYLLFFEPGPRYSITSSLRGPLDQQWLQRCGAILSTPRCTVEEHQLITCGEGFYDAHVNLINSAASTVHMETYILEPGDALDRIVDALVEKALHGVAVRVVLDRVGSFRVRRKHLARLVDAGGQVVFYHPLRWHLFRRLNNRSHRNLLVVDGKTGMVGGAGIADRWQHKDNPWRDCAVIVHGSAATQLQSVFFENWLEATGEMLIDRQSFPSETNSSTGSPGLVVGSSPVAGGSSSARILFQLIIASAQTSLDLCSPYFIPDKGVREELIEAKQRGVHIRILTSGPHIDSGLARRAGRRRYESLLENGVEIYEYMNQMMHLKSMVIDGACAVLGTTNIDNRSFNLNDEVNLVMYDTEFAGQVVDLFEQDLQQATRVTMDAWRRRSWRERTLALLGRGLERHD